MSFLKMPAKVVKKFTRIQSKFLSGEVEERRCIHWLKWGDVTLPLNKGGLGVKNLPLWFNILKARYGDLSSKVFGKDREMKISSTCSLWLKNIVKIYSSSLIEPVVACGRFNIHDGFNTPFWEAIWLEDKALKEVYPDLFLVSRLKFVSVGAMRGWVNGIWHWGDLGIPRHMAEDPVLAADITSLRTSLVAFYGWKEGKDAVVWLGNSEKEFSVASCYEFYEKLFILYGPPIKNAEAFGLLWEMEVPYKIKDFGWRLLHNRLPMKDLLVKRDMSFPPDDLKCIFCGYYAESRNHFFFGCLVVKYIWKEIGYWIGKEVYFEEECLPNFMD
ncbi:uncharacterized protein LOC131597648 [Vicia villosa]|uniref:uncharacterized protein LOC131597648 n=1 Tax=Vicia villosa TaxID=3911 RepID=UPI00273B967B|nr:uncharacterized protein LOC131597648 [Vicia villosa]